MDSRTLTHYNSIKTRRGNRDDHCAEAVKVKQWVVNYTNRVRGKVQSVVGVTSKNIDGPLEALGDCPQQHPESPDCAIMVCFIIRQYVNNVEVEGSMDGMTASAFRAEMLGCLVGLGTTTSLDTFGSSEAVVNLPKNVTVPAVIAFGDSIVDQGNNNVIETIV
ncbi:hypothetical protein TEA_024598 [Camellia sinensis var. sinensis]|uniref:Uncharacterized protein n=1 Tax=Camellia sinensis var. sinensis TaxID=542762 RepID=A0A4S4E3X6_CAMSN|nr:hypothetical protein TEA_024598 [Camellia sinensis var. sinensis]